MQNQKETVLVNVAGVVTPLVGATVTVLTNPGATLATLFSDNGVTGIANPLVTDANGAYSFYAADGRYTVNIAKTGYTTITRDIILDDPQNASIVKVLNGVQGSDAVNLDQTLTALAAAGGSSMIGFQPDGVSAVISTVLSKLRERKSIYDFLTVAQIADTKLANPTLDLSDPLAAAQAYVAANSTRVRLVFPSGIYRYSVSPNWAVSHSDIYADGEVRFRYIGTGHAVIADAGSGLVYNMQMGRFIIEAPATALNGGYIVSCHHSRFGFNVRGCGSASAALQVKFAVVTEFDNFIASVNQGGWYLGAKPAFGIDLQIRNPGETVSYCLFRNPIVEGCNLGIQLNGTLGNIFMGGTSEGCTTYGMFASSAAHNDKFLGTDFEANGTADAYVLGNNIEINSCDSTNLISFGSTSKLCTLMGGQHRSVLVDAGSTDNSVLNIKYNRAGFTGTYTDVGTRTRAFNVLDAQTGVLAGNVDKQIADQEGVRPTGAKMDGVTDDAAAWQLAANTVGGGLIPAGTTVLQSGITFNNTAPTYLYGRGPRSFVKAGASFPAAGNLFTLSPAASTDPKNWTIKDFAVLNASATLNSVFFLDIAAANKYLSKLTIAKIIAPAVNGYFVELSNPININGLFTSVFEDNWSMNGYFLSNSGDSMVIQRNTITGAGRALYINQLGTASSTTIRDNNITSAGGALLCDRGYNLDFEWNQVECPVAHTGTDLALVNIVGTSAITLVTNAKIRNNNINAQANTTLGCVHVQYAESCEIDANTLYCYPGTGNHITVDAGSINTYIGLNKYYSSTTGTEIVPLIIDNGIGTMGIWKDATVATWSLMSPVNGFNAGYFKTRDGMVQLRGNLAGAASTPAQTLFTLPVGFRPSAKVIAAWQGNAAGGNTPIQILPTGEVQIVTAGNTSVYLDGFSFSTK